jgi:hypothetical protein
LLGWIGFGVPDWQAFQRFNGSTTEFYGLWAYCQEPPPIFNTICKRWPTAEDQLFNGTRPDFVRAAEGLITVGMIFLTFGLIAAVVAAILPLLAYLAGGLTFIGFLFLIIGLPIFGKQSNDLSDLQMVATRNKRYGFWLIVPTIVLSFLASIIFFVTGFIYQKFGFGNIATHSYSRRQYGGQRLLGPANVLAGMPYGTRPGLYGAGGMMVNPYQYQPNVGVQQPSLLSQYIAQRMPRYYGPVAVRRTIVTAVPQPSVVPVVAQQPTYVTPAYYRAPAINLTGRTIVGPLVRTA